MALCGICGKIYVLGNVCGVCLRRMWAECQTIRDMEKSDRLTLTGLLCVLEGGRISVF